MVAYEKTMKTLPRESHRNSRRMRHTVRRWTRRLLSVAAILLVFRAASAQNLNNAGSITNTGTFRVKNQATGLPASVDGVFEYFGADQTVPARQYQDLMVTGSGIKSTAGGSFAVSGNLIVANGIVLDIQTNETLTLTGILDEQGYVKGSIGKTVNLVGGTTSSTFGNIGSTISWTGNAPGQTTVTRVSATASTGNGNQSILRYYDIASTFSTGLNGTLILQYSNNELNGHDPGALEMWRSPDNGVTWRRQGGSVDTSLHAVSKSGIVGFSRWTLSDTLNLLGPTQYEWVASSIALASGDNQSAPLSSTLSSFVVTVEDFFGNPIQGAIVAFAIDSIPSGATGQSLSVTNAVTNASGQASTVFTLGDKAGVYHVTAASGQLIGSPYTFTATGTSAAAALALVGGNGQQDTVGAQLNAFSLRVVDSGGSGVPGVNVQFSVLSAPTGAAGTTLSDTAVVTGSGGVASTFLTLGDKTGSYIVRGISPVLPALKVDFNGSATAGAAAALIAETGTTIQQDTILQVLDTVFAVRVVDRVGNPAEGIPVLFAITNVPAGAAGQSLSVTSANTDSNGIVSTRFTLGTKTGTYQVAATSGSLTNSPVIFNTIALHGAPAALAESGGSGQTKPVTATLDTALTARITDIGGNPIQGVPVQFTVAAFPPGATGFSLGTPVDTTDLNGDASTGFTLGTKAGQYVVRATATAVAGDSAVFTLEASSGTAALLLTTSGDGQTNPAGTLLAQPFVSTVHDAFGNPVEGVPVLFSVTSSPAGATGQQLTPSSGLTDSLGRVSTVLRLGNLPGTYVVTAQASGATPTQFTATALFILADVNNNLSVDVADLTSIIDHILQKRVLSGIDSVKADVNADGAIDVLDIVRIQNTILGTATLTKGTSQSGAVSSFGSATGISGELEITPVGLRLNLTNDIQVKGIQLALYLKAPTGVSKTDVVFSRAASMQFFVNSQGSEMRMLAYNLQNVPIEPGSGSIVRFPLKLIDTTDVDSVFAIVSTADTSFDIALQVPVSKKQTIYPSTFRLLQNYPNPFNAQTTIEFDVPDIEGKFAKALVQVFNLLGEKVKTLSKGEQAAGHYKVTWDGTDQQGSPVPSGVYFYRLVSTEYVTAKKMIMIK